MPPVTTIGLIRHFEVVRGLPGRGLMTAGDVHAWMHEYDHSDVIAKPVDHGDIAWQRCYASTSARAIQTAQAIHAGPIITTDQLREPDIQPFNTGRLKLPYAGWKWLLRFAWMTSHPSQRAAKVQFLANINTVVETLRTHTDEPTLVVSHAGVMIFLRKALLRRGFEGPKFTVPEPGRLYIFSGRWR